MKVIYGLPHLHDPSVDGFILEQHWGGDRLRLKFEEKLAFRLDRLNSRKVFIEGSQGGKPFSPQLLAGYYKLQQKRSPFFPILRHVAKLWHNGVEIEGMENKLLLQLHLLDTRSSTWFERTGRQFLDLAKNKAPLSKILSKGLQLYIVKAVLQLHRLLIIPFDKPMIIFRDFAMAKWIQKRSVQGVNVAIYGAAHNPLRLLSGKFEIHYLVTPDEINSMMRKYIAAHDKYKNEQAQKALEASRLGD